MFQEELLNNISNFALCIEVGRCRGSSGAASHAYFSQATVMPALSQAGTVRPAVYYLTGAKGDPPGDQIAALIKLALLSVSLAQHAKHTR